MSRPEITTPEALTDESVVELSLRPQRLSEFIGQQKVKDSLRVWIDAALARAGVDGRGARAAGAAGPFAVLRAARPWQDDARRADRARAGGEHPDDVRA